jgi:hypothetical protein
MAVEFIAELGSCTHHWQRPFWWSALILDLGRVRSCSAFSSSRDARGDVVFDVPGRRRIPRVAKSASGNKPIGDLLTGRFVPTVADGFLGGITGRTGGTELLQRATLRTGAVTIVTGTSDAKAAGKRHEEDKSSHIGRRIPIPGRGYKPSFVQAWPTSFDALGALASHWQATLVGR